MGRNLRCPNQKCESPDIQWDINNDWCCCEECDMSGPLAAFEKQEKKSCFGKAYAYGGTSCHNCEDLAACCAEKNLRADPRTEERIALAKEVMIRDADQESSHKDCVKWAFDRADAFIEFTEQERSPANEVTT